MKEKRNFNRKKKLNGWIDFQSNYLPGQLAFFWLQRNSQHTIAIHRQTCVLTLDKSDIRNNLPPSSLVGLKSSVFVAYSSETKHEIGSTVGLLGLLEF